MNTPESPTPRFGLIAITFIAIAVTLLGSVVYFTAKRNPPKPPAAAPASGVR